MFDTLVLLAGDLSSSQLLLIRQLTGGNHPKICSQYFFLRQWDMPNIQKASNLELIIELMFDGECRMVKSLVDDEPFDTRLICKLLASRTGRLPINKLEYWYEWFVDDATLEKTSDKNLLKKLYDFKCNYDEPM